MSVFSSWLEPISIAGFAFMPGEIAAWVVPVATFALGLAVARRPRGRRAEDGPQSSQPVIPSYRAVHATFTSELDRVRRYDRALSILVLKLEDLRTAEGSMGLLGNNGAAPDAERESLLRATRHVMFWNVGYALVDLLRETDLAACDVSNRRYVVLLPEAGEELANLAAQRIEQRIQEAIGVSVRKGVAVYRSDGLTIGDLVRSATAKCDRTAAARPAPRGLRSRSRFPRVPDPRTS
jgi:hypothetical protein